MDGPAIVAIGGSAGGLDALRRTVRTLPDDFPAPICVVLHISPDSPGLIPEILNSAGPLPAMHAEDGGVLKPGHIFVAPPDRHFILAPQQRIRLGAGPKENMFRPAIDPLMRSAAQIYGPRSIGLILSGGLDDGVAGLAAIKKAGGVALVQDPSDAAVSSMPRAALRHVAVDRKVRADEAGQALATIIGTLKPMEPAAMVDKDSAFETEIAMGHNPERRVAALGDPSLLTCPDCGGVLVQMKEGPLRFRCHTGHAFSAESLSQGLKDRGDEALWRALRALQEREILLKEQPVEGDGEALRLIEDLESGLRALLDRNDGREPQTPLPAAKSDRAG